MLRSYKNTGVGGVAQWYLPSVRGALGSIPSAANKNKLKIMDGQQTLKRISINVNVPCFKYIAFI